MGEEKEQFDKRNRGMGGLICSCAEENLLCSSEDRYHGRDICSHEFAHCLLSFGLDDKMQMEVSKTHEESVKKGRWKRPNGDLAYAGTNHGTLLPSC